MLYFFNKKFFGPNNGLGGVVNEHVKFGYICFNIGDEVVYLLLRKKIALNNG